MILTFNTFIGLVIFWLALCCFCGLKRRYALFLAVVFMGLCTNSIWLSAALKAAPLSAHALTAQGAAVICAMTAFYVGRFFGRIKQAFADSRV